MRMNTRVRMKMNMLWRNNCGVSVCVCGGGREEDRLRCGSCGGCDNASAAAASVKWIW